MEPLKGLILSVSGGKGTSSNHAHPPGQARVGGLSDPLPTCMENRWST